MATIKKQHTGNIPMMLIITSFWVVVVIGMAWQTWGFIDWLLPNNAVLMKALVLINFDIAALIWFCIRNLFKKITRGGYDLASWGAALDGLLSFGTTVFWFVIQYILRFDVGFQSGLVTVMYIIGIVAFTLNAIFTYFFIEIEWRFYHPVTFVDEDGDEEAPLQKATRKPVPITTKVRVAQEVESASTRTIKQLPAPQEETPEELEDDEEMETTEIGEAFETEEEVETAPLHERVVAAKNALLPPRKKAKRKLPTQK